ncbi:hypothetical protein PPTG_20986 [Phytophthora nicotianae INRA-310]|uniref:Uncharacterized protein n=1 Tax=Phytophthora nicotianae (strain INRA-310) TaxID=761204 RepID=W2RF82_PHYN3|nr:hypothetical protein PPTG_20986 [Phytophthora nicotianae INRA-310]ETN23309.1 hypothetical protein PPTG_20986 [Phytophthora nicotianae INRA-310]
MANNAVMDTGDSSNRSGKPFRQTTGALVIARCTLRRAQHAALVEVRRWASYVSQRLQLVRQQPGIEGVRAVKSSEAHDTTLQNKCMLRSRHGCKVIVAPTDPCASALLRPWRRR